MQQVWRKRWRSAGWIALGAITLVLLVSAAHKKNNKVCNGIEVSFNRDGSNFFVDEKGVVFILKTFGSIKGVPVGEIDLKALEAKVRNVKWIANAELFFDNKQVLQVIVEEKEPVARIFTVGGSSFYIDSACRRLPLSEKLSARIPMFTNFPSDRTFLSRPDSELLASAKELAMFIQSDEFWKAQVAQVDITPDGFEMIPTVGSHLVKLGKDGNWEQKFDRLFSFYKQVLTKLGFETYEKIDVEFDGQVVATIKGSKPARVDSTKARMAYETVLAEVRKSGDDSIPSVEKNFFATDTGLVRNQPESKQKGQQLKNVQTTKILPLKTAILKSTVKKVTVKKMIVKKNVTKKVTKPGALKKGVSSKRAIRLVPKAVMKPAIAA